MQTLAEIVLSNAAIATLLALIAMAVGRYCRRPSITYGLWFLVLLKLVTPSFLRIPVPFMAQETTAKSRLEAASSAPEQFASHLARSSNRVESDLQTKRSNTSAVVPDPPDSVTDIPPPVQSSDSSGRPLTGNSTGGPASPSNRRQDQEDIAASEALRPPSQNVPWREMVLGVWVAGSIVYLSITLFRLIRFCREIRRPWPVDDNLQRQADILARRFGLSRAPLIKLVNAPVPPMLWAMRRPATILLPRVLVARLSPQQRLTLLAHELAHYYRRDHWVRWFEVLIVGLYWWHPAAWLARRELQRAEEQCCDACVLWVLPDAGHAYARAILETVDFLTADCRPTPALASGLGPVHLLERRFEMILHTRPTRRLNILAKWFPVLLGLVVLPISAKAQALTPAATPAPGSKIEAPATAPDLPTISTQSTAPEAAIGLATDPKAQVPVGPTQGLTPSFATPATAIPNDTERRLERLEKMMESILSETKSQRPSNRPPVLDRGGALDKANDSYGSSRMSGARDKSYSQALSLSDLKKQRIDVEDELENLKSRLSKIDDQIAKLQNARSAVDPTAEKPQTR